MSSYVENFGMHVVLSKLNSQDSFGQVKLDNTCPKMKFVIRTLMKENIFEFIFFNFSIFLFIEKQTVKWSKTHQFS
jgi:hypothetical protein